MKFFISFLILLLAIKPIGFKLGCIGVGLAIVIIGLIIYNQLMFFKKNVEEVYCSVYFKDGSIFKKICLSKIFFRVFAFVFSFILSFSLVSFMYLSNEYILAFVFLDGIFIYFIYNFLFKKSKKHLQDKVALLFAEMGVNFLNIILFIIVVVIISYLTRLNIPPEFNTIMKMVHDDVYHPCKIFKWILRTKAIFTYAVDSIPNIKVLGEYANYLYVFLLVTSISFFPAVALSLYYKWFLRLNKNFEEKRDDEKR